MDADHQAARNLRAEMAALQRAIWDEISRIAESYKSELQIAKSQEEVDRQAHDRGVPAIWLDATIPGALARTRDRREHLSQYLRDIPDPVHSIGAATIVSFDRGAGCYGSPPRPCAKLA